jgi:Type IV secretion-system coupling protein DNA-binding domain
MNNSITPIGISNYQNRQKHFGIKQKDRAGHIYCLGKTGTGKSTLLLNMVIHDIQTGKGAGIIDPHGDLAREIIDHIPESRMKDVVYFDTTDTGYPIAFNPLHKVRREDSYLVASSIVTSLKKLWLDSWGPRLEHILRHTILSLIASPNRTLLDITTMLTDYEFRKRILFSVDDKTIHEFWQKEFEPLSIQLKNEMIAPILNKVGLFRTHPVLRNILGQNHSAFEVSKLMDEGKIFIANLSKGMLGEAGTQLLGSLLITQFQTASLERSRQPELTRRPFHLYVDEVHSFMTLSFADILSESRKYGLCLFLTHQYIDQLEEEIRTAIFGNVGTLVSFRVGAIDAEYLAKEFYPVFEVDDLINLPRYSMYLKLMIDGATSKPFSAMSLPPQRGKDSVKEKAVELSRKKYGKERALVEKSIFERNAGLPEKNKEANLFESL